ncbi:hypothetical protein OPV22_028306 [Ensete ventricosum]|uniref:Uncharacterized protein n=1 Tax=Ensete ventricosum TaxID=4639 RepID=A0AAV8Q3A2_ENSVE|nr:hypothetical protein OPV22_028306 [Ensete ventricosum]
MALPILYPHPTVRLITIERTTEACIVTHNPPPVNLTSLRKEELRRFGHLNGFDSPLPGPSPLGSTWTSGKRFPPHTPFINWSRLSFLLPEKSNHCRRSDPPSRSVREEVWRAAIGKIKIACKLTFEAVFAASHGNGVNHPNLDFYSSPMVRQKDTSLC